MKLRVGYLFSTLIATNGELDSGVEIVDTMEALGMVKSKSEARRLIEQGGVYLNDTTSECKVRGIDRKLTKEDLVGEYSEELVPRGEYDFWRLRHRLGLNGAEGIPRILIVKGKGRSRKLGQVLLLSLPQELEGRYAAAIELIDALVGKLKEKKG